MSSRPWPTVEEEDAWWGVWISRETHLSEARLIIGYLPTIYFWSSFFTPFLRLILLLKLLFLVYSFLFARHKVVMQDIEMLKTKVFEIGIVKKLSRLATGILIDGWSHLDFPLLLCTFNFVSEVILFFLFLMSSCCCLITEFPASCSHFDWKTFWSSHAAGSVLGIIHILHILMTKWGKQSTTAWVKLDPDLLSLTTAVLLRFSFSNVTWTPLITRLDSHSNTINRIKIIV